MPEKDTTAEIEALKTSTRKQLLDLWAKLYSRPAPEGIRRELLVPFLAYRIQELAFGGLKPKTRSTLLRIACDFEKPAYKRRTKARERIKPGTRILRTWRGRTHTVTATESGFEYDGATYSTLSPIARHITGARWSGPAFFGLKNGKRAGGSREL